MRDETNLPKHLTEEELERLKAEEQTEAYEMKPTPQEASDERQSAVTSLVVGIVLIVNVAASYLGWTPLGDPETIAGLAWTIASTVAALWQLIRNWWWKNNNLTEAAQAGQKLANLIRALGGE